MSLYCHRVLGVFWIKIQNPSTRSAQDERVSVIGSKYILHKIVHWKGHYPPDRQLIQSYLCGLCQQDCLAGKFYTLQSRILCKIRTSDACSFILHRFHWLVFQFYLRSTQHTVLRKWPSSLNKHTYFACHFGIINIHIWKKF